MLRRWGAMTFTVLGPYAYGMLMAEAGIHRLIRPSPSQTPQRTALAAVEVAPFPLDDDDVPIAETDLRLDSIRTEPHAPWNSDAFEDLVLTHLPTGLVVCRPVYPTGWGAHRTLLRILRSRLLVAGSRVDDEARCYLFHPTASATDPRTGYEREDVTAVLDGDIDGFIAAAVRRRYAE